MNSFYSEVELKELGFKSVGNNVLISRNACFYGANNMSIGSHVRIDDFCILSGKIEINSYIHIAAGSFLFAGKCGIVMQDFSGLSSRCAVYAESDDYTGFGMTNPMIPERFRMVSGGQVTLEKHVLIATGCTILPNVTVHEGTSVGAMSLVNKSLDEWSIYSGIPCKRIAKRRKNILKLEKEFLDSLE